MRTHERRRERDYIDFGFFHALFSCSLLEFFAARGYFHDPVPQVHPVPISGAFHEYSLTYPLLPALQNSFQILRQRKLQVDRRTLLVDKSLSKFGDHVVPLWIDNSVAPTQRVLTVTVEPKR